MTEPLGGPADAAAPGIAVMPMPTPSQWKLTGVRGSDGSRWLMVEVFSCTGRDVFFLEPDYAENKLGPAMVETGRQAGTGLILPSGPTVNGTRPG